MSYQIKCPVCKNEYILHKKPASGIKMKCCICNNVWQLSDAEVAEYIMFTDKSHVQNKRRHKVFAFLLCLFMSGLGAYYITQNQQNFIVLDKQMTSMVDDKYITVKVFNSSKYNKFIKSIKLHFEQHSIEYKVNVNVSAQQVYEFQVVTHPTNALLPDIEVIEG